MKRILVVDDERGTRESIRTIFSGTYEVDCAEDSDAALKILGGDSIDLILLDVNMPGKSGIDFLREMQDLYPDMPVVMISAMTSVRPVVEAMRTGARDYVTKPFDVQDIKHTVERAIESTRLHRRIVSLESEIARTFPVEEIVGNAPAFTRALEDLRKAADTEATVLIHGESGTGKELAARYIHAHSSRRDEPFVAVHCAALPESLMESELFGHEKGAFTNADRHKPGRFDLAGSGTLFFDEVGEMTPSTQVKLLRVLQEHEFMRVGGTRVIRTNARIVAATARDLRSASEQGDFRSDLFYRLSVVPVPLPPLRERDGDVELLASYFLEYFGRNLDVHTNEFAPAAMHLLRRYPWPGNVRELRNIIERMLVLHGRSQVIEPDFLPEEFQFDPPSMPRDMPGPHLETADLESTVDEYERRLIEKALRETGGVQTRAAKLLGTTRRKLKYRMQKLDIPALPE